MDEWTLGCHFTDEITGKTARDSVSFHSLALGDDHTTARPMLLRRLWPGLKVLCGNLAPHTVSNSRNKLRQYWNFLDEMQELGTVLNRDNEVIDDLGWGDIEASWRRWVEWLRARHVSPERAQSTFGFVKNLIEAAHQCESEARDSIAGPLELFGYFRSEVGITIRDSLSFSDAREIFKAVRLQWRESVARLDHYNSIADQGRVHSSDAALASPRKETGYWMHVSNRLFFVRKYYPWGNYGYGRSPIKNVHWHLGVGDAPSWRPLVRGGKKFRRVESYLGAVFPTQADLAIAAALVAMKTPLNPSTIGNLRASHWYVRDPQHPDKRVVIFARKARSNGEFQKAYSSISGIADPYQVISTVIRHTEPLRVAAREILEHLRSIRGRSPAEERMIQHLERVSDAVWIYPSPQYGIIDMGSHLGHDCRQEHRVLDRVLREVRLEGRRRCKFRLSDGRDIWAQYVYERSGHNLLLTQQTLGHKGLGTLVRYLNSRVIRTKNFVQLSKLQDHVFVELKQNRFDPRLLRKMLADGLIEKDVAQRLENANTSRLGLVCSDPKSPDRAADPGHRDGDLCREQNCMFCSKWYATAESLPFMQRALLDLEEMERVTPVLLWETSSYPLWRAFFQSIVERFAKVNQAAALQTARTMSPILLASRFASTRGRK